MSTHSLISLSAGLFQNPLILTKIFLLLGFRQVSPVPYPDVCSFPATPPELVFPHIVLSVGCCPQRRCTPQKSLQNHRGLTSPHLTSAMLTSYADLDLPTSLPHQQKGIGALRIQFIFLALLSFSLPPLFIMIQ